MKVWKTCVHTSVRNNLEVQRTLATSYAISTDFPDSVYIIDTVHTIRLFLNVIAARALHSAKVNSCRSISTFNTPRFWPKSGFNLVRVHSPLFSIFISYSLFYLSPLRISFTLSPHSHSLPCIFIYLSRAAPLCMLLNNNGIIQPVFFSARFISSHINIIIIIWSHMDGSGPVLVRACACIEVDLSGTQSLNYAHVIFTIKFTVAYFDCVCRGGGSGCAHPVRWIIIGRVYFSLHRLQPFGTLKVKPNAKLDTNGNLSLYPRACVCVCVLILLYAAVRVSDIHSQVKTRNY